MKPLSRGQCWFIQMAFSAPIKGGPNSMTYLINQTPDQQWNVVRITILLIGEE